MHNITPKALHAIINARIAISAQDSIDPNHIADGLNELLRDSVASGFMADYEFIHSDLPASVEATDEPHEGELFESLKTFMICIQDRDYNEDWVKVESSKPLDKMDKDELKSVLEGVVALNYDSSVFVGNVNTTQRFIV